MLKLNRYATIPLPKFSQPPIILGMTSGDRPSLFKVTSSLDSCEISLANGGINVDLLIIQVN